MTRSEQEFFEEIMILLNSVPQASPNPYDMTGWIHAARDYEKVHGLVYSVITNYCAWATWKGKKDVDEGYIEYCEEKYQEALDELKEFIKMRKAQQWN